ncbi:MAG: hypothetical protein AB7V18_19100 [Pyrinomonadaceae bacterium]
MAHVATLWQIALDSDPTFSSPVASIFTTTHLTTLPFSGLVLQPSTDYIARAAYYTDEATVSPFGATTAFTTLADGTIPVPILTEWFECE